MLELLKGLIEEGLANWLCSELNLTMDIAGKTGTSQTMLMAGLLALSLK